MPWHDVHAVIYGASAQDLARHFIEYWNHAKIDYEGTKNKKEGAFLKPMNTETSSNEGGSFKTKKKFDNESESSDSDFETNYEDSLQQQQSALQPIDEEEESEMMYDINREIAKNELHEGSIAEDKNEDEEDKNEDGDNEEDKNEQNGHYDTKSKDDNHTNQDSESDESDYLEEEDDKVIDVENGNDLADIKILASK